MKKAGTRPAFFVASPKLLGGSGSRSGSIGGSSSRGSGVGGSGRSSGISRSSGGRGSSLGSRSGSSGFFFLATSGQTQSQQSGEQDGVFHLDIPLVRKLINVLKTNRGA